MGNTHAVGRKIKVNHPDRVVYSIFSDLRNFVGNLPADMREKVDLKADADTLLAKVQGFELGIKAEERLPFLLLRFVQYGATPIAFNFMIHIEAVDELSCEMFLEIDAELGTMMKMMVGGKIKEMVDKLTDELEKGLNGQYIK